MGQEVNELRALAVQAEECASFYEGSRGLVSPETTIDLYRAIARLGNLTAQAIEARRAETQGGSVHESAVRQDAPNTPEDNHD